jgi:kynureninase
VCIDFEGSEDACWRLIDMGFMVDWRSHGGIRISPHFYNSDDECQDIMTAIRELRASGTLRDCPEGPRVH